ncbi:ImmA/IrrE family metallo-endopeptidase [Pontibacter sp. JH31]|uniref:ImmA/IrrE family metallo-endopeptidase n=1 Tax=Pontibacter aquaedesilientis TaxID=2766980 RepID=A0ABR7XKM2_9BACT|nr:ImmA/IrrE family metallo-endopeptidase [Pontibacter aquaedesilientis]MBD1398841.1 ImmA/IrrE family metallo-endopeptidase [Pontibacter aquaedesilientis]
MLEEHTRRDIEKVAEEILSGSKCLGVFPTPVDKIISFSELSVNNDLSLSRIHSNYIKQADDKLFSALAKIRGILDREEKVIYLDLDLSDSKRNFVKLHEVGHEVLPWQKNLHEFMDDDVSLSEQTNEEFEAEANFFASATLFQLDRFEAEMSKIGFGMKAPMALAKKFGASVHASLRRFVESNKKRCGLIVLENVSPQGSIVRCSLRDIFLSSTFRSEFGEIHVPQELGYKWAFVKDYYFQKKYHERGSIEIISLEGESIDCAYHFFNNSFNAFVLFFPRGENRSKI